MKHKSNLRHLMGDVAFEMEKLGYSANSMKHYWEVWNRYRILSTEQIWILFWLISMASTLIPKNLHGISALRYGL